MAIKFFNIRSGETQVAETEAHIAAMWSSSDHSPNITQGQDFGWRLAPEIVVELKRIKQDVNILQMISSRIGRPIEDITEPDILGYISAKTTPENSPVASNDDYQDLYDQEVRRLSGTPDEEPTVTVREMTDAELEAELEKRKMAKGEDVTTTTTEAPKKVNK